MLRTIEQTEEEAKKILPAAVYDHIAGGAGNENALRRNTEAYAKLALLPRVLREIETVELNTEIFGAKTKSPILFAPTAFHKLINSDGEIASAKAADLSGCIMIVSMMSSVTLEIIAKASNALLWFQIHIHGDFTITEQLIHRAEIAGYKAIVITVDIPQMGMRSRDEKNEFKIFDTCTPANFKSSVSEKVNLEGAQLNPKATWDDIKRVRLITKLPIIIKGIMHESDAVKAVDCGVNGIIVSNHGGRQLDESISTLDVLAGIADKVKDKVSLFIDGGIRSGSDIVKALALGADAVLIGRPILWGLAVAGKAGVVQVIDRLNQELTLTMKLIGCRRIIDIKQERRSILYGDSFGSENLSKEIKNLECKITKIIEQQNQIVKLLTAHGSEKIIEPKWKLSKL